mmetsp:Transcript_1975/g.6529  ORF Transcript_1975/g.6529 Transcript_1975/m.6529 type:complete len:215 (-) Transcript_1975:1133-1777(-)
MAAVVGRLITSSPSARLTKARGSRLWAGGSSCPCVPRSGEKNCGKGSGSASGAARTKREVLVAEAQESSRGMTPTMAAGSSGKPSTATLCEKAEAWEGGSAQGESGHRKLEGAKAPPRGMPHARRPATSRGPRTGGGSGRPRTAQARLNRGAAWSPPRRRERPPRSVPPDRKGRVATSSQAAGRAEVWKRSDSSTWTTGGYRSSTSVQWPGIGT